MKLKQIWMSPDTAQRSRYGLRTLGGIAAVTVLMLLVVCGGVWLSFALALPRELFSLLLVCGATALAAVLALRVGWRSARDATVFFLTEDGGLYALDARSLAGARHGLSGYAAGVMQVQQFLRKLAQAPYVPAGADEILQVAGIRENRTYYAVRCRMRRSGLRTWCLVKGCADEAALLQQLERRQRRGDPELSRSRTPACLFASALALAVLAVLCVLSHPAVGRLPQAIYFPCLWASFAAACALACCVIRLRRGE